MPRDNVDRAAIEDAALELRSAALRMTTEIGTPNHFRVYSTFHARHRFMQMILAEALMRSMDLDDPRRRLCEGIAAMSNETRGEEYEAEEFQELADHCKETADRLYDEAEFYNSDEYAAEARGEFEYEMRAGK